MSQARPQASIAARFTAAAPTYERHAEMQVRAADEVMSLLDNVGVPERILEIGCGTGLLTRQLVTAFPEAEIVALDLSPSMAEEARQSLETDRSTRFLAGGMEQLVDTGSFDLVTSSSSIHWMIPLVGVFETVTGILRPGGCFVFSIMLNGTLQELREARAHAAPHKMPAARLPETQEVLEHLGAPAYEILWHEEKTFRAVHGSAADFLQSIHEQGLTGGPYSSSGKPLTRSEIEKLIVRYDEQFSANGDGVYATYRLLTVFARRAA